VLLAELSGGSDERVVETLSALPPTRMTWQWLCEQLDSLDHRQDRQRLDREIERAIEVTSTWPASMCLGTRFWWNQLREGTWLPQWRLARGLEVPQLETATYGSLPSSAVQTLLALLARREVGGTGEAPNQQELRLEHLVVHDLSMPSSASDPLEPLLESGTLRHLEVTGSRTDHFLFALLESPLIKQLEHLAISHRERDGKFIAALMEPGRCSSLRFLRLDALPSEDGQAFWDGLDRAMPALEGLELHDRRMQPQMLAALSSSALLRRLKELRLSLGPRSLDALHALLETPDVEGIESLSLTKLDLTLQTLTLLTHSPLQSTLRRLDLSDNPLTAPALAALVDAAHRGALPALEHLALRGCGLGSTAPERDVLGLLELPSLTQLDLSHNKLDSMLAALAGTPALARLQQLELSHNKAQVENCAALLRSPHLRARVLCLGRQRATVDAVMHALSSVQLEHLELAGVETEAGKSPMIGADPQLTQRLLETPGTRHFLDQYGSVEHDNVVGDDVLEAIERQTAYEPVLRRRARGYLEARASARARVRKATLLRAAGTPWRIARALVMAWPFTLVLTALTLLVVGWPIPRTDISLGVGLGGIVGAALGVAGGFFVGASIPDESAGSIAAWLSKGGFLIGAAVGALIGGCLG
jgi:Leucine-rich repeat (LRR) protein